MRTLKDLLPRKRVASDKEKVNQGGEVDEKTLFFVCKKILVEEYGVRGGENIIPTFYKDKKLFLSPRSSLWGNEVWLGREYLKERINAMLGREVVMEVKIAQEK